MEISINKPELLRMLQVAASISSQNTSEPIINNALLKVDDDNRLNIKATNFDNHFQGKAEVEVIQPGQVCLNTSKLFNLVREFRGKDVLIRSTPQNWVYLNCGSSEVKLPGIDAETFPPIDFKETGGSFVLSGEAFRNAIERTFFAVGENESRRNLMGLNMEIISPDMIKWTGADGFRISRFTTVLSEPAKALKGNIIIPKRSLAEIKRIVEYYGEETIISFDDNIFQISLPNIKFKTKLIDDDFPNLNVLTDNIGTLTVHVPKTEIINGVRLISAVAENDERAIMKLTLKKNLTVLESQKLELGEGNTEIKSRYSGKKISIGLNVRFFLDALKVFESSPDEMITINFDDPESPVLVRCDEWQSYRTVLLPVKIKW